MTKQPECQRFLMASVWENQVLAHAPVWHRRKYISEGCCETLGSL